MARGSSAALRSLVYGVLLAAAAWCLISEAFVPSLSTKLRASTRTESAIVSRATGEYTGFVPDMQRRTLMNLVVVAVTAVPVLVFVGGVVLYVLPQSGGGAGGAIPVGDAKGEKIKLTGWMATHKAGARELVQGLNGEPSYLITTDSGIKDFSINSTCTHLGCVVPWNIAANRYICPCHGSQYDENGKVVRGPAPLSLALAHTVTDEDGFIAVSPWTETDFRTGLAPWWKK